MQPQFCGWNREWETGEQLQKGTWVSWSVTNWVWVSSALAVVRSHIIYTQVNQNICFQSDDLIVTYEGPKMTLILSLHCCYIAWQGTWTLLNSHEGTHPVILVRPFINCKTQGPQSFILVTGQKFNEAWVKLVLNPKKPRNYEISKISWG